MPSISASWIGAPVSLGAGSDVCGVCAVCAAAAQAAATVTESAANATAVFHCHFAIVHSV
jgi:hypothetical protein